MINAFINSVVENIVKFGLEFLNKVEVLVQIGHLLADELLFLSEDLFLVHLHDVYGLLDRDLLDYIDTLGVL